VRYPCLPGELVADHLDVDSLAHVVPDAAHKVLIDPRLELTHPTGLLERQLATKILLLAPRACGNSPESGLASTLTLAVAASAAGRAHVSLWREAVARSVHGLAHVAGLRGRVVHVTLGLALLELIGVAVVEGHDGKIKRGNRLS